MRRSKINIYGTDVPGRYDFDAYSGVAFEAQDFRPFKEERGWTAAQILDWLLQQPLTDIFEFSRRGGDDVNHVDIHDEARRRGKPIDVQRRCDNCQGLEEADPSCPGCGAPLRH